MSSSHHVQQSERPLHLATLAPKKRVRKPLAIVDPSTYKHVDLMDTLGTHTSTQAACSSDSHSVSGGSDDNSGDVEDAPKVTSELVENLNRTAHPWKPRKHETSEEVTDGEKSHNDLLMKFRCILNKITLRNFENLEKQAVELPVKTEMNLKGMVLQMYERAINEPRYASIYAALCQKLAKVLTVSCKDNPHKQLNFRKVLLRQCQQEFEKRKANHSELVLEQKAIPKESKEESASEEENVMGFVAKSQLHKFGNIRFICELFKLGMIDTKIIHYCLLKLLQVSDEDSLKCVCGLLATVGKELDTPEAKVRVDQYFQEIGNISAHQTSIKVSNKIRFALKDILKLREHEWAGEQREIICPDTIDHMHMAAVVGAKEVFLCPPMPSIDIQRGEPSSSGSKNAHTDERWSITSSGQGQPQRIDPGQLKLTRQSNSQLGPAGSSWSHGSSGWGKDLPIPMKRKSTTHTKKFTGTTTGKVTPENASENTLSSLLNSDAPTGVSQELGSLAIANSTYNCEEELQADQIPDIANHDGQPLQHSTQCCTPVQQKATMQDDSPQDMSISDAAGNMCPQQNQDLPLKSLCNIDLSNTEHSPRTTAATCEHGASIADLDGGVRDQPPNKNEQTVEVPLHKTEHTWREEQAKEQAAHNELLIKFSSVLGKCTSGKLDSCVEQILDLPVATELDLECMVNLVFERAISNSQDSTVIYATLCQKIGKVLEVTLKEDPTKVINFRSLLLHQCADEFDRFDDNDSELISKYDQISKAAWEDKSELDEELDAFLLRTRIRKQEYFRFIGALYELSVPCSNVMHACIASLLKCPCEDNLKCLCKLLTSIGKKLDSRKAKLRMDQYFGELEGNSENASSTTRLAIQNILHLRANKWIIERDTITHQTVDQTCANKEIGFQPRQNPLNQFLPSFVSHTIKATHTSVVDGGGDRSHKEFKWNGMSTEQEFKRNREPSYMYPSIDMQGRIPMESYIYSSLGASHSGQFYYAPSNQGSLWSEPGNQAMWSQAGDLAEQHNFGSSVNLVDIGRDRSSLLPHGSMKTEMINALTTVHRKVSCLGSSQSSSDQVNGS